MPDGYINDWGNLTKLADKWYCINGIASKDDA
jgi:hypothetical protein